MSAVNKNSYYPLTVSVEERREVQMSCTVIEDRAGEVEDDTGQVWVDVVLLRWHGRPPLVDSLVGELHVVSKQHSKRPHGLTGDMTAPGPACAQEQRLSQVREHTQQPRHAIAASGRYSVQQMQPRGR